MVYIDRSSIVSGLQHADEKAKLVGETRTRQPRVCRYIYISLRLCLFLLLATYISIIIGRELVTVFSFCRSLPVYI